LLIRRHSSAPTPFQPAVAQRSGRSRRPKDWYRGWGPWIGG